MYCSSNLPAFDDPGSIVNTGGPKRKEITGKR